MRRSALGLLAAAVLVAGCGDDDDEQPDRTTATSPSSDTQTQTETQPLGDEPQVETVATGLEAPWELAFLPDGRALISERPGRVRLLERDLSLREEPLAEIEVEAVGEAGLLGLAIDPEFERNGFVYIYRTVSGGNEVARYRLDGDDLSEQRVIADGIAAAAIHDGGRIRFGPDGLLYFSTGDAGQDDLAQDPDSLNGKILRLRPDQFRGEGGRPEVFTLGHRNPQGFDWEPGRGRMVEDEHGSDGDDEVNLLSRGGNYGWPLFRGEDTEEGFLQPVAFYPDTIAPSGASFVRRRGSEWTGDYLIGALAGEQIRRVRIEGGRVTIDEPLFEGEFGRVRTVVEGPDGALYALTNNRDGRGTPREGDDRVIRILPPA